MSKTLSTILRHSAAQEGIHIRSDGFCKLQEVMAAAGITDSRAVDRIVRENKKQRFEIKNISNIAHIRASQGHSIKSVEDEGLLRELLLSDTDLPSFCVHGTSLGSLPSIQQEGLKPGGGKAARNHIHFSPFEPRGPRSATVIKGGAEVGIWVDLKKALAEGVPFLMSKNGVILSRGVNGRISPRLFTKIMNLGNDKVYWQLP